MSRFFFTSGSLYADWRVGSRLFFAANTACWPGRSAT